MTRQQLERANELRHAIDTLRGQLKDLETMQKLCWEDADIAQETLHTYYIRASAINGSGNNTSIEVSAIGAYRAVSRDIDDIEKEIEKLSKEFSDL